MSNSSADIASLTRAICDQRSTPDERKAAEQKYVDLTSSISTDIFEDFVLFS